MSVVGVAPFFAGDFVQEYYRYVLPTRVYQTDAELAEAITFILVLIILSKLANVSKFDKKVDLPKAFRVAGFAVAVLGAFMFVLVVGTDSLQNVSRWPRFFTFPMAGAFGNETSLGLFGTSMLGLAVLGAFVFRMGHGLVTAIKEAALYLAAPLVILFELTLASAFPEWMSSHATNFSMRWVIGGVPILSNWFMLVTSSLILCFALVRTKWFGELSSKIARGNRGVLVAILVVFLTISVFGAVDRTGAVDGAVVRSQPLSVISLLIWNDSSVHTVYNQTISYQGVTVTKFAFAPDDGRLICYAPYLFWGFSCTGVQSFDTVDSAFMVVGFG